MLDRLNRLQQLRGPASRPATDAEFAARLKALKVWQHARLRHWYADLAANPRYAKAVAFFLDELYGPVDTALRDRDLIRMEPTMRRLLPPFAFNTVDRALELDVLSEEFDQAVTVQLGSATLDAAHYAKAFLAAGREADRHRQVALMRAVGEGLDVVVAKPLIYTTLKLLRRPAGIAGLGEMQRFLEAGFTAFRHMAGAQYFLDTIATRESALIGRLFAHGATAFEGLEFWPGRSAQNCQ
jgi:hypothetical protein